MLSVFICMPYGDHHSDEQRSDNTKMAMYVWHTLACTRQIFPYCPHLSHFLDVMIRENQQCKADGFKRDDWIAYSQYWMQKCDCVLVMTHSGFGITAGMKAEIALANKLRIPVFETYDGLAQSYGIDGL